ncbi:phosphonate ABC transporter ATP-binding protein [Nitrogeniibacter mangrovi]|uniref:Phosphonate ABC transporter ATP-binding protein n=1 Tax=Nitrogeniibacter mangrovi TaxID=2016596 RepID=A0A6C1B2U9_9RHOO|nr:phosphonate ABC transporter ATP-binding protein [Nitrogeniibacter mangrovi]QID17309.1 phosphonate ABC transporter ATP-binding protein [Nitrogeniibacter mangrovi]
MIALDTIRVVLDGRRALNDIRLRIPPGERVALIGPSGAGKTTLLRVLGATLRPSAGQVSVLGTDPWALSPAALRALRARIGKMHQSPPLPPRQRVVTAVLAGRLGQWPLWRSLASLAYPLDIDGARAVLAPLGLDERLFDRCGQLSGGQLQRVALARVLYQQPALMLADEPVSALDPALARSVTLSLNDTARARGVTLVASLHAVDLALDHFSRVIGLRDGRIAFDLPAAEVDPVRIDALYAGAGDAAARDDEPVAVTTRLTRCA